MGLTDALGDFVGSVVGFIVMIILAVIAFYFSVFVVGMGAELAGYSPSGDFVVLSATLLVVASALGGALGGNPATDNL